MSSQQNVWLLLIMAIAIGAGLVSQAGINAQLRTYLHSPIQAAFISFFVGTIALALVCLVQGQPLFKINGAVSPPLWLWCGGLLGAIYVAASIFLAPRMGALALALAILAGQVVTSLVLDQHGWLGYPKLQISWNRILGIVLIIFGVLFVTKK